INLYKLSERGDIRLRTLSDAKRYKTGAEYQDVKLDYLLKNGFKVQRNIELVRSGHLNLRKLLAKRIDLLLFDEASMVVMLRKEGQSEGTVAVALPLPDLSYDLHLAASRKTRPELVARLRTSMAALEST